MSSTGYPSNVHNVNENNVIIDSMSNRMKSWINIKNLILITAIVVFIIQLGMQVSLSVSVIPIDEEIRFTVKNNITNATIANTWNDTATKKRYCKIQWTLKRNSSNSISCKYLYPCRSTLSFMKSKNIAEKNHGITKDSN